MEATKRPELALHSQDLFPLSLTPFHAMTKASTPQKPNTPQNLHNA